MLWATTKRRTATRSDGDEVADADALADADATDPDRSRIPPCFDHRKAERSAFQHTSTACRSSKAE